MITNPDSNSMPANTTKGDSEADGMPVEEYSAERKAEFLLSNAVDELDYAWAVRQVRTLGVDPDAVPHERPRAVSGVTPSHSAPTCIPRRPGESRNRQL